MSFKTKFSNLGHPNRIWTVAAIHGAADKLRALHARILPQFQPGDRLVYTGNYFCGPNARPRETIEEILSFRRALLAEPGMVADDFVYLRGLQEELWSKLLQMQFELSPRQLADWIVTHHPEMEGMLKLCGSSLTDMQQIARDGIMSVTKWSSTLKNNMRAHAGLEKFFTVLRRAAFTENPYSNDNSDNNLLIVHAGIKPGVPLTSQGENLWAAHRGFNEISEPYHPFCAVVRGADPAMQGVHIGTVTISLDGGAGRGGQLVCGQLSNLGKVNELIAV